MSKSPTRNIYSWESFDYQETLIRATGPAAWTILESFRSGQSGSRTWSGRLKGSSSYENALYVKRERFSPLPYCIERYYRTVVCRVCALQNVVQQQVLAQDVVGEVVFDVAPDRVDVVGAVSSADSQENRRVVGL